MTNNNRTKRKKNNNLYAKIRINAAKDDRKELDLVEAAYDFNSLNCCSIHSDRSVLSCLIRSNSSNFNTFVCIVSDILVQRAIERQESFGPVVHNLREKLGIA